MNSDKINIIITEKQILHTIIDNPHLVFEEDIFITEIAKEYQCIFLELKDENLTFIPEHIIKKSIHETNEKSLQAIYDTQYQVDKFNEYKEELKKLNILNLFDVDVLPLVQEEIKKGFKKDIENFYLIRDSLNKILLDYETIKRLPYYTFYDALEKHEDILIQRYNSYGQGTGCYHLDKIIKNYAPAVATLTGRSGSMKTTFINYITKVRLQKKMPTLLVNTEISFTSLMDNTISSMMKIPYMDIIGINEFGEVNETVDTSVIVEKYNELKMKFFEEKNFLMYPYNSCNLNQLKVFIKDARRIMELPNNYTLMVLIDLLSMIEEMNESKHGMNKADTIESSMNILNSIALETNSFILGTLQFKEDRKPIRIETEEQLEKLKPSPQDIKGSNAFFERSRYALGIFNRKYEVTKNNCNPVIRNLQDSTVEIFSMKDSMTGTTGQNIKYYFNPDMKVFLPNIPNEEENQGEINND